MGSSSRINVRIDVAAIRICRAINVRGSVRVAVRVGVVVSVLVCIPVALGLVFVFIRRATAIGISGRLFRFDCFRSLPLLSRSTYIHRDRLSRLHDFICARELEQYCVGIRLIARPYRAHAEIQISCGKDLLSFEPVFPYNIRDFHLRAAQGEIDCGADTK